VRVSFWVGRYFRVFAKEKNPTYIYVEIQQNACNLRWKLFEVENTFSQAKTKSAEVTDKAHARNKNNMHTCKKTAEDEILFLFS